MSLLYPTLMPFVNDRRRLACAYLTGTTQEDITVANLGKALTFPLPENDVARVFGVPRNVLLDVSVIPPRLFPTVNFLPAVPYSIEGRVSCARRDYKTCGSATSREPGVEPRKQICPVSVPFRPLSPFPA
jgi:hypothetical protein